MRNCSGILLLMCEECCLKFPSLVEAFAGKVAMSGCLIKDGNSTSPNDLLLFIARSRGTTCVSFSQVALTISIAALSRSVSKNARSSTSFLQKSWSISTAYLSLRPSPSSATARLRFQTLSTADVHVLSGTLGPDLVKKWSHELSGHCASNSAVLSFRVVRWLSSIPLPSMQLLHQLLRGKYATSCPKTLPWLAPQVPSWARHLLLVPCGTSVASMRNVLPSVNPVPVPRVGNRPVRAPFLCCRCRQGKGQLNPLLSGIFQ